MLLKPSASENYSAITVLVQ